MRQDRVEERLAGLGLSLFSTALPLWTTELGRVKRPQNSTSPKMNHCLEF